MEKKQNKSELRKDLHQVFLTYCSWGKGTSTTTTHTRLSNRQFIKMCRDSGIISRQKLNTQALDLAFSRKKCATISFPQFEDVLIEVATRGRFLMEDLFKSIADLPANAEGKRSTEEDIILHELTLLVQKSVDSTPPVQPAASLEPA